jgi:GAF domain-containing protein
MSANHSDNGTKLAEQLRSLMTTIEASGKAVLPYTNLALLQSIVETANRFFDGTATAIALVTPDGEELEFVVAYNIIDQDIVGLRFPAHSGIAGYVTMTGQPMAVSKPTEDPRFNREVAEQSGYIPGAILAVPLISGDHVFGVIEVLDKVSGHSFDLRDIELLSLLADQAAIALTQAKQFEQLQQILVSGLKELVGDGKTPAPELQALLDDQPATSAELIRLAELLREVSALGEKEREACAQIIRVFKEYSASEPAAQFGVGPQL